MKKTIPTVLALLMAASTILFAGCAVTRTDAPILYDLGAPGARAVNRALPALPPISIAEVNVPAWLDSTSIFYRLEYANGQQPRPYSQARWTMTPAQLLSLHLKSRISRSGGVVLSAADGASGVPMLRIEADDFTQYFDAPERSNGKVSLRASIFRGRVLVAQKTFHAEAPAPSGDAAGGANALAAAADAVVADVIAWMATIELK